MKNKHDNHLAVLALACTTLLATGGALADPAKIKQAEEKPALTFADGDSGRPSFLKTIRTRTDAPPARIGELQNGMFCGRTGDVLWDQKSQAILTQGVFQTFRAELEKAHYPLVKTTESMFDDKDKEKPKATTDLQVGAFIREAAANFCFKSGNTALGGAYVKVFWQVFAPDQQKVLFETVTEGSYQIDAADKLTADRFFQQAFAVATRNLLADARYMTAIKTPVSDTVAAGAANPSAYKEVLKLKAGAPSAEPLAKHITTLRSAVVTVSADNGSGSGFFVSQEGHVLTNRHVVGTARFVKVTLPTGRELVGEVLRSDTTRDIALIKTEPLAVQPMALRTGEPNIGEEVYALGSPLGDKFNTTLTRGILSGYRNLEDNRFLQSDVIVQPGSSGGPLMDSQGSVVGVTVMGVRGVVGMNFFIPISDALTKLNIDAGR